MRSAVGRHEAENLCIARFGDNMRHVAVTEGDKVEAQIAMGIQVDGYGIGDLVESVHAVSSADIAALMDEYGIIYTISDEIRQSDDAINAIAEQARIELGMKNFLDAGGYGAFTTTFENLYGLPQLPGLAVQRLMSLGYGFGAEGDWKHSALVRIMKRMAAGLPGGTSFMEDYTYNMDPEDPMVLGAHMLEVCPGIGVEGIKPSIQVHPLGIGGKKDPARLVFDGEGGDAVNVSLVDMGNRLRLIVNEVSAIRPVKAMPKLPVARVLWKPKPDFKTALEGWIHAGGAHHTCFSTALRAEHIDDFAVMTGLELIRIGDGTTIRELKNDLLMSDLAARL
jgi:L-arabinose isomerase